MTAWLGWWAAPFLVLQGLYGGMIVLAYLPPLWFKVMNPRVRAHFTGDMSRVNIKPSIRERMLAQAQAGAA